MTTKPQPTFFRVRFHVTGYEDHVDLDPSIRFYEVVGPLVEFSKSSAPNAGVAFAVALSNLISITTVGGV